MTDPDQPLILTTIEGRRYGHHTSEGLRSAMIEHRWADAQRIAAALRALLGRSLMLTLVNDLALELDPLIEAGELPEIWADGSVN